MKRKIHLLIFLLGFGLFSCSSGEGEAGREPTIPLEDCRLSGGIVAQCGTLTVQENRDIVGGRTIDLDIAVFPATGSSNVVEPDPLFLLAGGPGPTAQ